MLTPGRIFFVLGSVVVSGQDELEGRAMTALNSLEARTLQKIQDLRAIPKNSGQTFVDRQWSTESDGMESLF